MSDDDQVDARFRALEARIASLEAASRARLTPVNVVLSQPIPAQAAVVTPPPPAPPKLGPVVPRLGPTTPAQAARPVAAAAARVAAPAGPSWSAVIADLEEKLTGRALAVVGGVALVAGAIFFLSLAFSRGWIGPEGRVLIGVGAAGVALALGAWMLDHRQPTVGRVLVAVGLAVASLAAFAATRLYGLVPVEIGLLMTLAASIAAAFLAVRHDAQIIAVLALIAVLGAPPILGASPNLVTVAYIGSVLAGFSALALFRTWRWLPSIAFALSAPQLASWLIGDVVPAVGLIAAVIFWVLNTIAAGGEEYLRPAAKRELRLGSATLLLANAAFFIWAGFTVLAGPNEFLRGPFLIAVALAHVVIGGWFLLRESDRHPFGLLAAGTGVAALAMAAPVQFGGPPVPIAWAAEGAALAWLASRRAHPQALLAAAVLGALAFGHLVGFEYPAGTASPVADAGPWPFVDASGLSLAFLLGAATVAAFFLRSRTIVATIASLGVLAVVFAAPHELAGPALIAAWVALGLGALALARSVIDRLPLEGPVAVPLLVELRSAVLVTAAMVGAIALGHALAFDLPLASFGTIRPPVIPFSDERALTLVLLVVGAAISGWVHQRRLTLELPAVAGLVVAGSVLAYGSVFEVYADAAIVIAAGLAAAGFALGRVRGVQGDAWGLATGAGLVMAGIATVAALQVVAGLEYLSVANVVVPGHPPFISSATVTCAAIVAALAVGVRLNPGRRFAAWAGLAAGALAVYGLSIGVVDLFQARIPGPIAFEEVATQAQVAMSVLWIVLGAVVFMFGLGRRHLVVRQAGLALLGLASLKVFVFDLASLDVAYRVLSLVALGTFLLITAWVYARLRPPTAEPPPSTAPETSTTDAEGAVA